MVCSRFQCLLLGTVSLLFVFIRLHSGFGKRSELAEITQTSTTEDETAPIIVDRVHFDRNDLEVVLFNVLTDIRTAYFSSLRVQHGWADVHANLNGEVITGRMRVVSYLPIYLIGYHLSG